MSLERFITLWTHPDYPPDRVAEADIERAERELHATFPADYRQAVIAIGVPRPTIALLDFIVDRELDLSDVSDFLAPADMVNITKDWQAMGLPADLVAFATDCMGNMFCFPNGPDALGVQPILFFDHDSGEVETIASSFGAWIDKFCRLAPRPL